MTTLHGTDNSFKLSTLNFVYITNGLDWHLEEYKTFLLNMRHGIRKRKLAIAQYELLDQTKMKIASRTEEYIYIEYE